MKILNPEPGFDSYQKAFKQMQAAKSSLIIWQVFPENGKRMVNETRLTSYDLNTQLLQLTSVNDFLDPSLPVFFYVEDQHLIFRSNVSSVKDDSFTASFPAEMKVLDFDDYTSIKRNTGLDIQNLWKNKSHYKVRPGKNHWTVKAMSERSTRDQEFLNEEFDHLSLDEEEKMFADKRESPRVRPKVQKLVKVVKKGETEENFFDLFDLSRGGMAFITALPDVFPKGTEILITGFDAFDLDDPLLGVVMSHRAMDGSKYDVKIGVKFDEGQA